MALIPSEESFALAVVSSRGNVVSAVRAVYGLRGQDASALAQRLLSRPDVAMRINELQEHLAESVLISRGSHLAALAEIRDSAAMVGRYQEALAAERYRGEVVGYYMKDAPTINARHVTVNFPSVPATSLSDWSQQHGVLPQNVRTIEHEK